MLIISQGGQAVSFLSKASIAKYPLFGAVAKAL
jgi:hypothetical protein